MAWFKIVIFGAGAVALFAWRRFVGGKSCQSKRSLRGKTVIITGANTGIGKATACELAKREARVILACRDVGRGVAAVTEIRRQTSSGQLIVKSLDLSSLRSVQEFAEEIQREEDRVDILVNNAGVYERCTSRTVDGLEKHMGVNHFGHFLLTNLLLKILKASAPSRVVIVSSILMKYSKLDFTDINQERKEAYGGSRAYAESKLANALFCRELARRVEGTGVGVFCVSPGLVLSSLGRHVVPPLVATLIWPLSRLLIKTPSQGCQTVLHCCLSEQLDGQTGRLYRNCTELPWPDTVNESDARALWIASQRVTHV